MGFNSGLKGLKSNRSLRRRNTKLYQSKEDGAVRRCRLSLRWCWRSDLLEFALHHWVLCLMKINMRAIRCAETFKPFVPCILSIYGIKTNWCHYFNFIYMLPVLYMFRAHRSILRRVHTAVHTTIGSVSVLLWPCALYVVLCFIPYFERMHGTKGLKILLLLLLQIYY